MVVEDLMAALEAGDAFIFLILGKFLKDVEVLDYHLPLILGLSIKGKGKKSVEKILPELGKYLQAPIHLLHIDHQRVLVEMG